jgi:hypothetical protein
MEKYIKTGLMEKHRKFLDIDFYLKEKLKRGDLLLLDFEKGFDCVKWSFLESTFRKFGFDKMF